MEAREAFGRDDGEDDLESMGWAAEPVPPRYTPPPRGPGLPTGPSRMARTAALLGIVLVVAGLWAVSGFRFHALSDIHLPKIDTGLGSTERSEPPVGLSQHSMLRRGNLSPALRDIERKLGGRVKLLRIESSRLDVQVVGADGKVTLVQRRWDAKDFKVLSEGPGAAGPRTFAWRQINASAPARIVRSTAHRRTQDFAYVVLNDAAGLRWSGFVASGKGYLANTRGLNVRPIAG